MSAAASALAALEVAAERVRSEHSPDPRLGVFEVSAQPRGDRVALVGAVSDPEALRALHAELALLPLDLPLVDEVVRLPDLDDDQPDHALVGSPLLPMMSEPEICVQQVSQQVLGRRLLVLLRRGKWLQCRSEEGYLGWVHTGYVVQLSEVEARGWEVGAGGESCWSFGAELRDESTDARLVPIPWGAIVVREHDGRVRLPDGRRGAVRGDLMPLSERAGRFPADGEALVESALKWMGSPYIWGGVTPAGVDCSGLAQGTYRLHGWLLPRDADQQSRTGEAFEPGADFSACRPGDLLFFSETGVRVTHVTISMGGSRIVHASLGNGGVGINDLLGDLEYERELRQLFVGARRIFPAPL